MKQKKNNKIVGVTIDTPHENIHIKKENQGAATLPACGGGSSQIQFEWDEPSHLLSSSQLAALKTKQARTLKLSGLKAGNT